MTTRYPLVLNGTSIQELQNSDSLILPSALSISSGGTGLTSFTSGGVVYASSTSALATGSALTFDGTNLGVGTSSPPAKLVVSNAGAAGYEVNPTGGIGGGATVATYNRSTSAYTSLTTYASTMTWYSGSTRAMDLDASGNLGIGTSSSANRLSVFGANGSTTNGAQVRISNTTGTTRLSLAVDDASNKVWFVNGGSTTNPSFNWSTNDNNTALMTLDNSGNLGLGVTPSAWGSGYKGLQVNSGLNLMGSSINGNLTANAYYDGTYWRFISNGYATTYYANYANNGSHVWGVTSSGTAGLGINATSGVWTTAMTLDASGNLGLATSSITPRDTGATTLELYGPSSGRAAIKFTNSTSGTSGTDGMFLGYDNNLNFNILNNEAGAIQFGTSNTERARIDASGNIIVGSTGTVDSSKFQIFGAKTLSSGIPQQQLNIADTSAIAAGVGGAISFSALFSGGSYTTMGSIEGVRENATSGNYAGTLLFKTRANGGDDTERMRIDSSGNLLVGTTSGSYTFTLLGSCYITNTVGGSYNTSSERTLGVFGMDTNGAVDSGRVANIEWKMAGNSNGQFWYANYITQGGSRTLGAYCTGTGWTNSSDIANKEEIESIKYGLSTVMASRPVDFRWKSMRDENGQGKADIGFVAQEMELLVPEVVTGQEGGKGISYGNLVAIAFKAIQEQQALIQSLKARLDAANL